MRNAVVYYIDFSLLISLIRRLKKELVFHCQTHGDIFDGIDIGTVTSQNEINYLYHSISVTRKSQYFFDHALIIKFVTVKFVLVLYAYMILH